MEQQNLWFAILFVLPILAYTQEPVVYDITKNGAKQNSDIAQVLATLWKKACQSPTPSKIVIPEGTWPLSQARLEGPNKAHIEIENRGTIQASPDPHNLPNKKSEWIMINYIDGFTLSGGGIFDGQGQQAWKLNNCHNNNQCLKLPINLSFNFIKNAFIHDVTTKDSKNFHSNCISSQNVTFQRYTVSAPGDSPNTDGLHIARGKFINVLDSIMETGDDCVSMGDELSDVQIKNITCGPGHGISIGSLGKNPSEKDVSRIYITNCTFINTMNGVRVKTWPSAPATLTISDLHFEDLIMVNASNPVIIDQQYCPWNLCNKDKPSLIRVTKLSVKNVRGTSSTAEAMTFTCSSGKPCDVEVGNVDITYTGNLGNITTKCSNVKANMIGKQNMEICPVASKAS